MGQGTDTPLDSKVVGGLLALALGFVLVAIAGIDHNPLALILLLTMFVSGYVISARTLAGGPRRDIHQYLWVTIALYVGFALLASAWIVLEALLIFLAVIALIIAGYRIVWTTGGSISRVQETSPTGSRIRFVVGILTMGSSIHILVSVVEELPALPGEEVAAVLWMISVVALIILGILLSYRFAYSTKITQSLGIIDDSQQSGDSYFQLAATVASCLRTSHNKIFSYLGTRNGWLDRNAPVISEVAYSHLRIPTLSAIALGLWFAFAYSLGPIGIVGVEKYATTGQFDPLTYLWLLLVPVLRIALVLPIVGGAYGLLDSPEERTSRDETGGLWNVFWEGVRENTGTLVTASVVRTLCWMGTVVLLYAALLGAFTAFQYVGYWVTPGWRFLLRSQTLGIALLLLLPAAFVSALPLAIVAPAAVTGNRSMIQAVRYSARAAVTNPLSFVRYGFVRLILVALIAVSIGLGVALVGALILSFDTPLLILILTPGLLATVLAGTTVAAIALSYRYTFYQQCKSKPQRSDGVQLSPKVRPASYTPVLQRLGVVLLLVSALAIGGVAVRWTDQRPGYEAPIHPVGDHASADEILSNATDLREETSHRVRHYLSAKGEPSGEENLTLFAEVRIDYENRRKSKSVFRRDDDTYYIFRSSIGTWEGSTDRHREIHSPRIRWSNWVPWTYIQTNTPNPIVMADHWQIVEKTESEIVLGPANPEVLTDPEKNYRWPENSSETHIQPAGTNRVRVMVNRSNGRLKSIEYRQGYNRVNTSNGSVFKRVRSRTRYVFDRYESVSIRRPDLPSESSQGTLKRPLVDLLYY